MHEITKDHFPLGKPVIVEAITDRESGWEFDAPMIFMVPFVRTCITGSIGDDTTEAKLEDIMLDIDCGIKLHSEGVDPELQHVFARVRSGHDRDRWHYSRLEVVVTQWGDDTEDFEMEIRNAAFVTKHIPALKWQMHKSGDLWFACPSHGNYSIRPHGRFFEWHHQPEPGLVVSNYARTVEACMERAEKHHREISRKTNGAMVASFPV